MNFKNRSSKLVSVLLTVVLFGCSANDEEISSTQTLVVDNKTVESNSQLLLERSEDFDEVNEIFENIKMQLLQNSEATLIAVDDRQPTNLSDYLAEIQKTDFVANSTVHLKIDTKGQAEILDVYAIQSALNSSNYLIVMENELFDKNIVIDAETVYTNGGFTVVPSEIQPVTNSVWRVRWNYYFSSSTFSTCMQGLMGSQIIWGLGVASGFGCAPCGAAGAAFSAAGFLACAGGSVTNW